MESISGLKFGLSSKLLFTLQKLLNVVSVFQLSPPARGRGRGEGASVCFLFDMSVCAMCIYEEYITPEPVFANLLRSPGIDSQPGRIDSLESNPGLLKRLQIWAQFSNSLINRFGFLAVFLFSKPLPHAD